jgi:conjugative transfer signal peptidase TraF
MDIGIYYLSNIDHIEKGDIVYIKVPKNANDPLYTRGYLEKRIKYLIKEVQGLSGDVITIDNSNLFLNNQFLGGIKKCDSEGKPLVSFLKTHIIPPHKFLLLGITPDSYDSRYFGLIDQTKLLKKCKLLIRL